MSNRNKKHFGIVRGAARSQRVANETKARATNNLDEVALQRALKHGRMLHRISPL